MEACDGIINYVSARLRNPQSILAEKKNNMRIRQQTHIFKSWNINENRKSVMVRFFAILIVGISQPWVQADDNDNGQALSKPAISEPWHRWAEENPDWVEPLPPFKVIGNIYYVGTVGLSSFLLTSNEGHILLDGGLPQNARIIANNIQTLGFQLQDVKLLLNSHAHFDHSGGLAELKELTGASLLASAGDKPELESGRYVGSDNPYFSAPPVVVDRIVKDRERVFLGELSLTANITPGHSPGCTSWITEIESEAETLEVLFFCSASVAANRLVSPPQYPGIVEDYRKTFAITKHWRPDVFLANHPFLFAMQEKIHHPSKGSQNPFIDRDRFPNLIRELERDFEKKLEEQKAANGLD